MVLHQGLRRAAEFILLSPPALQKLSQCNAKWSLAPYAVRDRALLLQPGGAYFTKGAGVHPAQKFGGTLCPLRAERGGGSGRFTVKTGACRGNRHGWAGLPRRHDISRGKGREMGEASRYRWEVRCESLMAKWGARPRLPFALCVRPSVCKWQDLFLQL